jgi:ribonuclease HI
MINRKDNKLIVIYTDGSCDPNPGPGGWAALIIAGEGQRVLKGSEKHSTNNRMELKAALEGIKDVDDSLPIALYTDSQYLQRGVQEWMDNWKARGWRRKGGRLANVDLWKEISREIDRREISWHWVRGHAGNPYNERVDQIAQQMAAKEK